MTSLIKNNFPVSYQPFALSIIFLLSLCFINSYNGDFVFDDSEAIVHNDDVKETALVDIFKNDFWGTKLSHKRSHKSYRPLTIFTFRIQYWLRGELISQDFHIVNIILHSIICMLTLSVFNILLGSKGQSIAFLATVLFTVHPIHTEAVSGIVGRAELLCTLFMWMSILFYNQSICCSKSSIKWVYMGSSIICILIAMLCKETGITAIGICIVYDLVVVNKLYPMDIVKLLISTKFYTNIMNLVRQKNELFLRQLILFMVALVLLSLRFAVMGFVTPTFQPVDNPASFMENVFFRILNYHYIYCLNVWLLICPVWLCFDWSMGCVTLITEWDRRIFFVILFWFIFGSLIASTFSMHKDKYSRYLIIGLGFLIIPFLPASNIFLNVGFVIAERTLYIPSAGYCIIFSVGLHKLLTRFSSSKLLLFYTFLVFIFFTRSWLRSNEWKTEKTLFKSGLSVCPLNAKVHYNVAKNAADTGNIALAKSEYEKALKLNPNYAQALNNLGNLLNKEGNHVQAENMLRKAIQLQKDFATAWMNLGIVLSSLKKYNESEKSYLEALFHRSKYPDCYYNLGVMYLDQKLYEKALKAWQNATKQQITHHRAWTNMILLLDDLGMSEEALKAANEALKYIPQHAAIHFNMANILGKSGQFAEAETHFKIALSQDSKNVLHYINLGVLYHRWNKLDDAEEMYRKALEINPNLQSAQNNLNKLKRLKLSTK